MELDAKRFTDGATLDTDICIVGGGPAGLVLASELVDRQCDVILLESGDHRAEPEILALNFGDATGDVYAGLGATRHRQVGGTTHLWNSAARGAIGAKCAPLDAADFRARPALPHSGWPFERAELEADYERAQKICGLGSFAYDASAWETSGSRPWSGIGGDLASRIYQFGARDALIAPLRDSIARAGNVRLCSHATAIAFATNNSGRRIASVSIATPGGPRWSVHAKWVVLAAGAVENARLLLVHNESHGIAGDGSEWVGRGFMEHPRDRSITLRPHSASTIASAGFYDLHEAANDTWIVGRLGIDDAALATGRILNASATIFPRIRGSTERLRAMLPSFAARWLPAGGHGWAARRSTTRDADGFDVLLNLEQTPHPDNRITLGGRRDALGVPYPSLHWEWRAEDQLRLERTRRLFASNLASVSTVMIDEAIHPDPNAHHHAGTTRMHDDPKRGVTDRHGRVHAMENLYVSGASTFPTAGFANPVLTIVAMSVRLARHLGGVVAGPQ